MDNHSDRKSTAVYHHHCLLVVVVVVVLSIPGAARAAPKHSSAFYPARLMENARANANKVPWAAEIQRHLVEAAAPWLQRSDDQLWELMFGHTITRSWMVWSSGHCPSCKEDVPMYNWQIDALARPWKTRCPHCKEIFPKNDFLKFYRSGLDEHGVFNPKRADRALLFNTEASNPDDPLHGFGVDDGNGYVDGNKRWRFIGAYLIYGQWKQAVVDGITKLAAAYVVSGDPAYAHKAGILLDRVADVYPAFDFGTQAILYEKPGHRGYVSTWHDACEEVRMIALAYDQIFEALRQDEQLVAFLSRKARLLKLSHAKTSFEDIQRNIEQRILQDTLNNRPKIQSNYPRTEVAITVIKTVLNWPDNRDEVHTLVDAIVARATAVDGMTGEKGLAGYSTIGPRALASLIGRFSRIDDRFLPSLLKRHPQLHQTYRFHIDTWCLGQYYPFSGDTGHFAGRAERYVGVDFARPGSLEPSAFTFLWQLYEATGDVDLVKLLYRANDDSVEGLPYDLLADDPAAFQKAVDEVIAGAGRVLKLDSVDKQNWHIAVLRSGRGKNARAVWLDYDTGGGHGHQDGMNLGLFARGLDLMPDFGYPPVQYEGWSGPKFNWYVMPASHNTVVVDGKGQHGTASGKTTLWADGRRFRAIRAAAPKIIDGQQFERTVAMIDLSDEDFYVVDVLRVVGGKDHAKFVHSHFGEITVQGLKLQPGPEYGHGVLMRDFRSDLDAKAGWCVDWTVHDRYGYLPPGAEVRVRYTDLTNDAQAHVAEAWVVAGIYGSTDEAWIPRLMVRRQAPAGPLASTFVGVIEPYGKVSRIADIVRLPLETPSGDPYPDSNVAIEIRPAAGGRDLIVVADVENPLARSPARATDSVFVLDNGRLHFDGELCMVRYDTAGRLTHIAVCHGRAVRVGDIELALKPDTAFVEIRFDDQHASVLTGDPQMVREMRIGGQPIRVN